MVGCAAESQNWMENLSKSKESHSHQGTKKYPIDVTPAVKFHMLQPPNVDTLAPGRTSSAANRHFPRSGVSPCRNGSMRFLRYCCCCRLITTLSSKHTSQTTLRSLDDIQQLETSKSVCWKHPVFQDSSTMDAKWPTSTFTGTSGNLL